MLPTLTLSRWSATDPASRVGVQKNCRILLNGCHITDVKIADAVRGTIKRMVRDVDGQIVLTGRRGADDPTIDVLTVDMKGEVEIQVVDAAKYVAEQRARLDMVEAVFVLGTQPLDAMRTYLDHAC